MSLLDVDTSGKNEDRVVSLFSIINANGNIFLTGFILVFLFSCFPNNGLSPIVTPIFYNELVRDLGADNIVITILDGPLGFLFLETPMLFYLTFLTLIQPIFYVVALIVSCFYIKSNAKGYFYMNLVFAICFFVLDIALVLYESLCWISYFSYL